MPRECRDEGHEGTSSTIRLVRFLWTDYSGLLRCKAVPVHESHKPVRVVCGANNLLPCGSIPSSAIGASVGEVRLIADDYFCSPRFVELPWHTNHQVVVGKWLDSTGKPWAQCPKAALARAVSALKELNLNVKAGFELEFALFTDEPAPGIKNKLFGYGEGFGLHDQFDRAADFLDDVIASLKQMDVVVIMVHAEGGPGQFEVVLEHKGICEALHDLVLARTAVKAVARKHGLFASFVPNYMTDAAGSGCHVHLSLDGHFGLDRKGDDNDIVGGVSVIGRKFMAGILHALPWLSFLLMSSPLSYTRLKPQHWVGAYQVWGLNNKEAPVRLSEDMTNFEVKLLDGVSNVDIGLAGLLQAGLHGILEDQQLPPPCQVDPHCMVENDRPALLPCSLQKSMAEFEKVFNAQKVSCVFSNEMILDLLAVKREEISYVKAHGIDAYRDLLLKIH